MSEPEADSRLLRQIAAQLNQQRADIEAIRWRVSCLFIWLVVLPLLAAGFAIAAKLILSG